MGFDSIGSDESSLFELAQRAEGFLMGFLQIGTDYRLEFDELLIFLLIGVLNISRQQDSFLFVPASMARINAVVKLSKESLRRRLLELQGKGLIVRSRQGFSVSDFAVWRGLALLLGPAPLGLLAAALDDVTGLEIDGHRFSIADPAVTVTAAGPSDPVALDPLSRDVGQASAAARRPAGVKAYPGKIDRLFPARTRSK